MLKMSSLEGVISKRVVILVCGGVLHSSTLHPISWKLTDPFLSTHQNGSVSFRRIGNSGCYARENRRRAEEDCKLSSDQATK